MKLVSLLSISFSFIPFICLTQYWQEISNFPGTARDDGAVFVIQNRAYCGTGLQVGWSPTRDFYVLNLENDTWETGVSLPAEKERQYACGFSNNQLGFIFGGSKYSSYLNDLWMYDPSTNSWSEKNPLPGNGRSGACCFVINNKAYVIGGIVADNTYTDEVWEYDIATDTWTQKNPCPFGTSFRASACSKGEIGYLLFGRNQNAEVSDKLVSYDPGTDSWELKSNFPLGGRTYSSLLSFGWHLVTFFGMDSNGQPMNDGWSYDVTLNQWTQLTDLPASGRRGGMCFSSADAVYYTTGIDTLNRTSDTWKFNELFLGTFSKEIDLNLIYDPGSKFLKVKSSTNHFSFKIIDLMGNTIIQEKTNQPNHQINLAGFSDGIYCIKINSENQENHVRFMKY